MKYLIGKGADIYAIDEKTLLYITNEGGDNKLVRYLIAKEVVNQKTLLYVAIEGGDYLLVKYFIDKGEYKNAINGKTLLYIAAAGGSYQLVKYFIERGADINVKSENLTPLHIAY